MASTPQEAFGLAKDPSFPRLGLIMNGKAVGGGQHIPRSETQATPRLTLPTPSGIYMAICLDLDAPFASAPLLSPILHWLQPGLHASSSTSGQRDVELDSSSTRFVADWAPAGPPPGAAPHRYVFLLYNQPDGFDGKKFGQPAAEGEKFGMLKRMRYDFGKFVKEAKLSDPVAANYFTSN